MQGHGHDLVGQTANSSSLGCDRVAQGRLPSGEFIAHVVNGTVNYCTDTHMMCE